jgi:hypothetical protein
MPNHLNDRSVEMATPDYTPTTRRALGHTFEAMVAEDYEGFAGAERGSWIAYSGRETLILSPNWKLTHELGAMRKVLQ